MSADSTGADLLLRSPVQHAVSVANMAHTDAVAKSVEDSDLTMSILEEMRVQFEFKAFGINRHSATGVPTGSPKSAKTSKMKTEREWNEMVHIIHHWNGGDGSLSEKEFRKKWSHKHKNWKSYSVQKRPDGTFKLTKTSPDGVEKKVLHQGLVFDVLLDKHRGINHMKGGALYTNLSASISNVSRDLCTVFVSCCPVCNMEQPKAKPHKGAIKAMQSQSFRDKSLP